jgi:hypothetical protein
MRRLLVLGFLCLPLLAQEKPPAGVDEALQARVAKFYQAHVDGKFRSAETLVAEDSKDYFFEMEKQRYLSFQPSQITYSENFTKAKAITMVKVEWRVPRMGTMIVNPPMTTYWKLEKGEWCWYRFQEKTVQTPFGVVTIPDDKDAQVHSRVGEFKKVTPAELVNQVRVNKSAVSLSSFQEASDEVIVANNLPGQVTVDVQFAPMEGLKITVDKTPVKTGETAKVLFDYKPVNSVPKGAITATIVVQPLNQRFPITVNFPVLRPVQSNDAIH